MIAKETVDAIFERIDIVDIVGQYVKLKKKGANYVGSSPFVNERTPSFVVSPAKGIFKCFSSGLGGKAINFLMEKEKWDYPQTLRWLASHYQIEFKEEISDKQAENRVKSETIYLVNEWANKQFQKALSENKEALDYLHSRSITQESIDEFQLGFAPDQYNFLSGICSAHHFDVSSLITADLASSKPKIHGTGERINDKFRERIMFPIHGMLSNRIPGFSGRVLKSGDKYAKYINTGDTDVFKKGSLLYGMHIAKNHINKKQGCNLLEGPLDVIALHQGGIKNTVCSSGTALTKEQLHIIGRFTRYITFMYDGDNAGFKAAARGIEMAIEEGFKVRVVIFPEGEDPHSFITCYGVETFQEYCEGNKLDVVDFFFRDIEKISAEEKDEMKALILTILAKIPAEESFRIDEYIKKLATKYNVPKSVIYKYLKKNTPSAPAITLDQQTDIIFTPERELARLLIKYGNLPIGKEYVFFKILDGCGIDLIKDDLVKKIIYTYMEFVNKQQIPSLDDFLQVNDPEIAEFVSNIAIDLYQISNSWEGFDRICNTSYLTEVQKGYSCFWINRYDNLIEANTEALAVTQDDDEINRLLTENIALEALQKSHAETLKINLLN